MSSQAIELQLITHPKYDGAFVRLVELVNEVIFPAERHKQMLALAQAPEVEAALREVAQQLPALWPDDLRASAVAAAAGAFNKADAVRLRGAFDAQPPEVQRSWGAYVRMHMMTGQCRFNGTQIRQIARDSWVRDGMAAHRPTVSTECPDCGVFGAQVCLHIRESGNLLVPDVLQWTLMCPSCGCTERCSEFCRVDCGGSDTQDAVAAKLTANPAIGRANSWQEKHAMQQMEQLAREMLALEVALQEDAFDSYHDATKTDRHPALSAPSEGWHLRLYGHGRTELRSEVLRGVVQAAVESPHVYDSIASDTDALLDRQPIHRVRVSQVEVTDPAAHWMVELEEHKGRVHDAIHARDPVRAFSEAVLLGQTGVKRGLITPLVMTVSVQEDDPVLRKIQLRRTVRHAPRDTSEAPTTHPVRQSLAVPVAAVEELADFLFKRLSAPEGVSRELVKSALVAYAVTQ